MTASKDISSMSFEEALKELEEVVGRLESENTPLEESIQLYETRQPAQAALRNNAEGGGRKSSNH